MQLVEIMEFPHLSSKSVIVLRVVEVQVQQKRWKVVMNFRLLCILLISSYPKSQRILVIVSPSLIQRRKTHFHNLPCGAHVILRNNRYIWISQPVAEGLETRDFVNYKKVPVSDRQIIVRLRNCISALAKHKVVIQDMSIMYAYEKSLSYSVSQLLLDHVSEEVVRLTALRLTQNAQ